MRKGSLVVSQFETYGFAFTRIKLGHYRIACATLLRLMVCYSLPDGLGCRLGVAAIDLTLAT